MEQSYFAREIEQIREKSAQLYEETGRTVVIAIDGMAAAGKTTLAENLSHVLQCGVIHMDDFFLPQGFRTPERLRTPGGNVYHERFRQEVLPFLRCGEPFAYRIFDAHKHVYTGMRQVPAGPYLIVEGAYACHPVFENPYDLRVFCKVGPTEQMRRVRERAPERAEMFEAMWIPMENRYFQANATEENSDMVLFSGPEEPEPPLEIERKYLIRYPDLAYLDSVCTKKVEMVQTYLQGTEGGSSRRVRKSTVNGVTYYRKNSKQKINGTTRIEKQGDLTEREYNILLGFADPKRQPIHKTRWCVPFGELVAEIDVFDFWTDRAICEVELPTEDTPVALPEFLHVIRDVTDDTRYTNAALAYEIPMDEI